MTNANATNITRHEALATDVIVAKGAMLKHAGFWAAVLPLAERAYKNGNDKEQWSGKGSTARPLRSCWLAAFGKNDAGKLPTTAGARAFRALAAFVAEQQAVKGRDTSPEGVDLFLSAAETIVAGILAPTREAKPVNVDPSAKADKAIETLKKLLDDHLLTEAHIQALGAIVIAAKPVAAKPVAAKPVAAKPVKAKPAEAMPA